MDTIIALRLFKTNLEQAIITSPKDFLLEKEIIEMINKEYQIVLERLVIMEKGD